MRPTEPNPRQPTTCFARLSEQIDRRHPVVGLAGLMGCGGCSRTGSGGLYHPHVGRPGIPIRLMVGSATCSTPSACPTRKEVVARWVENPYWQYFCGFDYLQLELPIDRAR